MKNSVLNYKNYSGSVEFDLDEKILFGQILNVTDLISYFGDTVEELEKNFVDAVDDYLMACAEIGVEPNKPFKGAFNVRVPPELHKNLSLIAYKEGTSLNALVVRALQNEYLAMA